MKNLVFMLRCCLVSMVVLVNVALAQNSLPKEVQADIKQEEIFSALKQKDFSGAQKLFEEYDQIDVKMPTPLIMMRAQVSFQLKNYLDAKRHLEKYLAVSERGSDNYKKALKMYTSVSPLAEPEERILEDIEHKEHLAILEEERKKREWENIPRLIGNAVSGKWLSTDVHHGEVVRTYKSNGEWYLTKKGEDKVISAGLWRVVTGTEAKYANIGKTTPDSFYFEDIRFESVKKKNLHPNASWGSTEIELTQDGRLNFPEKWAKRHRHDFNEKLN